ncbi:MAG: hypothetical protein A2539_05980 [Elusimicrobia bacterium RIFOXYD2_FULL_34_15]|nr:MAG: hypothetical protein A2539_05980 [Elusimicrobia bacterium RIFOXYD2_FULL_34_15]
MKKFFCISLLFIFAFFCNYLSAEHFTKMPLYGGAVETIAISPSDPTVLYVGTSYGGSFYSKDSAVTWTAMGGVGYNKQNGMKSIAVHPTKPNVIVGVTFNCAYSLIRSDDYGATLTGIETFVGWNGLSGGYNLIEVVASVKYPGTFYLLGIDRTTANGVLFKSEDSGVTWTQTAFTAPSKLVQELAVDKDDNIYVAVADVVWNPNTIMSAGPSNPISGYLAKSSDGGTTWATIKTFAGYPKYVNASSNTLVVVNNLYGGDSGTYISRDGGVTFSSNSYYSGSYPTPDGNKVYCQSSDKIAVSSFTGSGWTTLVTISSGNFLVNNYGKICFNSLDSAICYLSDREIGIYKSTDSGYTWNISNYGMGGLVIAGGAKDSDGNIYAYSDTRVYKGTNDGQTWNMVLYPDDRAYSPSAKDHKFGYGGSVIAAPAVNNVFVGCAGDLWRTTDGGINWIMVFSSGAVSSDSSGEILFSGMVWNKTNPTIGYFSLRERNSNSLADSTGKKYIFKTTDSGANWTAMDLTSSYSVQSLEIDQSNPTVLYAGMGGYTMYGSQYSYGGLWKIIDDGVNPPTWSQIAHSDKIPTNICVSSSAILISGIEQSDSTSYKYDQPTYYSKDGGVTWAEIVYGTATTQNMLATVDIEYSNSLYYVTDGQSVAVALDPQARFDLIVNAGDLGNIRCLMVGSMYSGADKGLYKLTYAPVQLTEVIEKPKTYAFPNPFNANNGAVTIKYFVPQGENLTSLKMSIYNIAGELIYESAEETYVVSGYAYYYAWDGTNQSGEKCAEGVYIVLFKSNKENAKTKIVLVR